MKSFNIFKFTLALVAVLCLVQRQCVAGRLEAREDRVKRQASDDREPVRRRPASRDDRDDGPVAISLASSSSVASSGTVNRPLENLAPDSRVTSRPARPLQQGSSTTKAPLIEPEDEETFEGEPAESRPPRRPNRKRPKAARPAPNARPKQSRPPNGDEDEDYEQSDGDCLESLGWADHDYSFTRPMREFGRVMGDMVRMASGDYDSYPDGANVAMASSSSFDDRNSRTSSIVRNNGRLRGFVSETRNGRTKVRKIGDDGAESDDEY